jgi:hypothetical protein
VSSREPTDPLEDGREVLRRIALKPPLLSRTGDLGAVRGENPEGGLAVRMMGGLAANSSKDTSGSRKLSEDG